MSREILGYIDCPHCGESERMRITPDKSGSPFGYCEECNGQLRIGGNTTRVEAFYRKNPAVKRPGQAGEPSQAAVQALPVTEPKKTAPKKAAPVIEPAQVKAPRKLSIFEQLAGVST